MTRTYSQDLRDRVIDAALSGASARQAADRFGIGDAKRASRVSRVDPSSIRIATIFSTPIETRRT